VVITDSFLRDIRTDVDSFVAERALGDLFRRQRDEFDPRRRDNHWVSIYPPLPSAPATDDRRATHGAMYDAWCGGERDAVAFLYFHMPFCVKKCEFCFFSISTDLAAREGYADTLLGEARAYLAHLSGRARVRHLYFGGGTPSTMPPDVIRRVIGVVTERVPLANIEKCTLEVHPKSRLPGFEELARERLLTRISMGVQTFDRATTEENFRIWADTATVRRICEDFRAAGVNDINLDFMTGLESQTLDHVLADIAEIDGLIRADLIDSVTVYPRSFNSASNFAFGAAASADSLLEHARMQLAYRRYMASIGWPESPMYFFARRASAPLLQPSSCVTDAQVAAKLGFGNGAYSYFDRTNFRNVFDFERYLAAAGAHGTATEAWHSLSDPELKRRHLVFGAKRGVITMDFPVPLSPREHDAIETTTTGLVARGLCSRKGDQVVLSDLGKLLAGTAAHAYEAITFH
jgi:coproporphyrinogen III oxidase-like Fe-S oxidoreductase